jgi:RNA recognition motif-containing protein
MQGFRHNQYYRLIFQVMNEAGGRTPSLSPSLNRGLNRGSRHGLDAKAIFVGSLPETVTEDRLRTLFSKYGGVLDCRVIRKSLGGKFGLSLFI